MHSSQSSNKARKNGDIRGFFRAAPPAATPSSPVPSTNAPSPPTLSSPVPVSSPRTPPKSTARRVTEVKGSDEDDDDSDDSLESISDLLGLSRPAAHKRNNSLLSTPQAKRIASSSNIHRSPLTLQQRKHKFDLKALINHSREDQRAEASAKEADALIADGDGKSDFGDDSGRDDDPRRYEEAAQKVLLEGEDDSKAEKLRNAMRRTQDHSIHKHCYFFKAEEPNTSKAAKNPFPHRKAAGPWKCLAQVASRRQSFLMRLPHGFLKMGHTLPDEMFLWILDEICIEQNAELRTRYVDLATLCEEQTRRLVTDMRMYAMLEKIGGPKYAREHSTFKSTTEVRLDYFERDWSPLTSLLQVIEGLAPSLESASAISAVQLLLRMSLDPIIGNLVREAHDRALQALVSNLAKSQSRWNTACEAICAYIYENIDDLELRAISIMTISSSTSYLVDLRRRLAAETLFHTPGLGKNPADSFLSYEKICNRLEDEDFQPRHSSDFEQLTVLTTLLDIVIGNGAFMHSGQAGKLSTFSSSTTLKFLSSSSPAPKQSAVIKNNHHHHQTDTTRQQKEANNEFNKMVDALAARVKVIHEKILDKPDRKAVKAALNVLEKRLTYAVRTRPPPKQDIFVFGGAARRSPSKPKQRDFMRSWALKKKMKEEADMERRLEQGDDLFADAEEFGGSATGIPLAVG